MKINYYEGGEAEYGETVRELLDQVRSYLTAMSEYGLAVSSRNIAHVSTDLLVYGSVDTEETVPKLDKDPSSFGKPLLADFDRGLLGLRLLEPDAEFERAPSLEVVWQTNRSMQSFGRLLDISWQMAIEYSRPGVHSALDQPIP